MIAKLLTTTALACASLGASSQTMELARMLPGAADTGENNSDYGALIPSIHNFDYTLHSDSSESLQWVSPFRTYGPEMLNSSGMVDRSLEDPRKSWGETIIWRFSDEASAEKGRGHVKYDARMRIAETDEGFPGREKVTTCKITDKQGVEHEFEFTTRNLSPDLPVSYGNNLMDNIEFIDIRIPEGKQCFGRTSEEPLMVDGLFTYKEDRNLFELLARNVNASFQRANLVARNDRSKLVQENLSAGTTYLLNGDMGNGSHYGFWAYQIMQPAQTPYTYSAAEDTVVVRWEGNTNGAACESDNRRKAGTSTSQIVKLFYSNDPQGQRRLTLAIDFAASTTGKNGLTETENVTGIVYLDPPHGPIDLGAMTADDICDLERSVPIGDNLTMIRRTKNGKEITDQIHSNEIIEFPLDMDYAAAAISGISNAFGVRNRGHFNFDLK